MGSSSTTIEEMVYAFDRPIIESLLTDRTTRGHLRWVTREYAALGEGRDPADEMTFDSLFHNSHPVVLPRSAKSSDLQIQRTRSQAEVFTPAWVCCAQNNRVDEAWFGRPGALFEQKCDPTGWSASTAPVLFDEHRSWKDYIDARVLEMSCGEGPYLTTRYDPCDGSEIKIGSRVGLLDRKMRVVDENATDDDEWLKWALRALEATYGFDIQGDNVLISRLNLLSTFEEHLTQRFGRRGEGREMSDAANRISWNVFQMDGVTFQSPFATKEVDSPRLDLSWPFAFDRTEPVPCLIYNWRSRKPCRFDSLVKEA